MATHSDTDEFGSDPFTDAVMDADPAANTAQASVPPGVRSVGILRGAQSLRGAPAPGFATSRRHLQFADRNVSSNPSSVHRRPGVAPNPAPARAPGVPLPAPTAVYNVAGYELSSDFRDPRATEDIDQTRYAKLAADIHTTGWLPWIKAAYQDELVVGSKTIREKRWEGWVRGCDFALAGTHPDVLHILTTGSLAQSAHNDPVLMGRLQEYAERADSHPAVYVRQLTIGPNKDNLTIKQAEDIIMFTRQYTSALPSKADEAFELDHKLRGDWQRAWSDQGFRALILDKNHTHNAQKKQVLQAFSEAMIKAVQQTKDANKTHIQAMYYVGCAADAAARAKQHNTNALIDYTKSLLELWDPTIEVQIETFPICLLASEIDAEVAEMLICRLARGYYYAGGFNQAQCGSMASALHISEEEWEKHREYLDKVFRFNQRLEDELKLRKAFRRKPFEDKNRELEARLKTLKENEEHLHREHKFLRENLDIDYMKNNEFLRQFVSKWEEFDKFIEDTPRD